MTPGALTPEQRAVLERIRNRPAALYPGTSKTDPQPADLYRCFNGDGELLYVGISLSAAERLTVHSHNQSWWGSVVWIQVEHHPSRLGAWEAEQKAIKSEAPIHNRTNRRRGRGRR